MKGIPFLKMTVAEWSKVMNNPRQRDTERRAKMALRKHLSAAKYGHRFVRIAVSKTRRWKVDGHTRSYLWDQGLLDDPPFVLAEVIPVANRQGAIDAYDETDNPHAVEKPRDRVEGAYRQHGFRPASSLLKSASLTSPMTTIWGRPGDVNPRIKLWLPELRMIDAADLLRVKFPAGILASTLVMLRLEGDRVLEFAKAYADDNGNGKIDGGTSGVDFLIRHMAWRQGGHKVGGQQNPQEIAGIASECCGQWLASEKMNRKTVTDQPIRNQSTATKEYWQGTVARLGPLA